MILCGRKSGANDCKPNLDFADTLDCLPKNLIRFSNKISKKSQAIHNKVEDCHSIKDKMQDLLVIGVISAPTGPVTRN